MRHVIYEINVLLKMIEAVVPVNLRSGLTSQLRQILIALYQETDTLKTDLEDLRLEVKAVVFDLAATKNERDELIRKLENQ